MMTIKIQCGCGQRYAFDVEPVNGLIASPVACPACGADGTAAANAIIARGMQPEQAVPPNPSAPLHIVASRTAIQPASSASASRRSAPLPGQADRAKAEAEARSKIFWGDPPKDVVQFLMMNGFSRDDAAVSVRAVFKERAAVLQQTGIRKIVTGILLMAVPVVALLIFAYFGVMILTLFVLTVAVGLWGAWKFLRGAIMILFPKFERGDVADQ